MASSSGDSFQLPANSRPVLVDRVPVLAEHALHARIARDNRSTALARDATSVPSEAQLRAAVGGLLEAVHGCFVDFASAAANDGVAAAPIGSSLYRGEDEAPPMLAFIHIPPPSPERIASFLERYDAGYARPSEMPLAWSGSAQGAAYYPDQQQQNIGDGMIRTKQPRTGSASASGKEPPPAPTDAELERMALLTPGALREINTIDGGALPLYDVFNWFGTMGRAIGVMLGRYYVPLPPQLIDPKPLELAWFELPVVFPVYVNYPGFGAGLALRYCCVDITNSYDNYNRRIYLAVQKYMPFGDPIPDPAEVLRNQQMGRRVRIHTEPFSRGIWAVPCHYTMRMQIAVAKVMLEDGYVEINDNHGRAYSEEWLEFRANPDTAHEVARRALLLHYPYDCAQLFATRYELTTPAAEEEEEEEQEEEDDGEGEEEEEEGEEETAGR